MKSIRNSLQKYRNRTRARTHTHTLVIVLLFMIAHLAKGQNAGSVSFGAPTTNSMTGITQFDVFWSGNSVVEATGVRIEINLVSNPSGEVVCIDPFSIDVASIHPDFNGFASNTNTQVLIVRFGSTLFPLQETYSPRLITVYFRAAPGSTIEASFGLARVLTGSTPPFHDIQEPLAPLQVTVPAPVKIGGLIRKVSGSDQACDNGQDFGISDVDVTFDANTTTSCFPVYTDYPSEPYSFNSPDGYYSANVPPHYVYTITPSKNGGCACGLDDGDINDIRDIILGYETEPTLAELMAADFNNSGSVTTFDIVGIRQCLLGWWNPPLGWTSWRFIPIDDYEDNDPPSGATIILALPSSITTPLVTYPLVAQDFYGIKRGDVDGSCSDCDDETPFNPSLEDRSATSISLRVGDSKLQPGEEIVLPVRATQVIEGAAIFSLELGLDSDAFELLSVEKGDLSGDYLQYAIDKQGTATHCRVAWFTMQPGGEALPDKGSLFHLRLRAKKNIESSKDLVWQIAGQTPSNLYYKDGQAKSSLVFQPHGSNNGFYARLTGANPTEAATQITVYLPAASMVEVLVYDMNGQLKGNTLHDLSSGLHQIKVDALPEEPGVYVLLLNTNHGRFSTRVVRF